MWNSLPLHLRNSTSLASFKRALKTFLFVDSFQMYDLILAIVKRIETNVILRYTRSQIIIIKFRLVLAPELRNDTSTEQIMFLSITVI